ncbi:MAG: ABC transporter permease [Candidatus Aenigmarchaeota archaeon]|nr:ABC transporter permease [Candidatus Aenigmarchaeota archaeon]
MKFRKCFKHAFNMVVHSKLRSWLTIIGIVIGVGSVVAILALSEGMQESMNDRLGALGGDILTLSAGYSRGSSMMGGREGPDGSFGGSGGATATDDEPVIDRSDVQALKSIPDIAIISPTIRGNVKVSYLGKSGSVSLTGVDQAVWSKITTAEIRDGRMLDSADQNVIVIGSRLADSYFSQPLGISKSITIEGSSFRIVGILDDESNSIYMPMQMAYQVLEDKDYGVYDSVTIKIKDEETLNETMEKITSKLMLVRHVNERTKDFTLSSSKQMQATRAEMMSSMTIFLTAIAAVSLIVGAVGIANTMFTSVLEKTKEIGIMKAIGARNSDIMMIFVLDSAIIGFVGGALGLLLGMAASMAFPTLMGETMMFRSGGVVSMRIIILALGVSVLIGVLSGLIPAYQASKLKPVDALRYE